MTDIPITIRNLGPEDVHILDRVRAGVFGNPVDPSRAFAFLATRVNEIVVALSGGEVIGFASGTVVMHPDREPAFFVNQVSVHEDFRRRGIAKRLLRRISELAGDRGCTVIWLGTEGGNDAARGLYRLLKGRETADVVMYEWDAGIG